jgi:DNA-binding MarR family transcriptional regulator
MSDVTPFRTLLLAIEDLARAQREAGAALARELDCPSAGLTVLRLLSRRGALHVGDVADHLRVDISVASRQISTLVDAGLVERTAPEGPGADRRTRTLGLTPTGATYAARSRELLEARAAAAFTGWTDDEIATAAHHVQRIAAAARTIPAAGHLVSHPTDHSPGRTPARTEPTPDRKPSLHA